MATVRTMDSREWAEARAVTTEAFATMRPVLPGPTLVQPVAAQWSTDAKLATTPDGGFVAEDGGAIVGVGHVRVLGRVGVIGPIAVKPEHQRRHHGEALTRACLAHARAHGCTTVGLDTFPDSPGHFALYSRLGFLPTALIVSMIAPVHQHDPSGMMTARMLVGARVRRWSQMDPPAQAAAACRMAIICAGYLPGYDPSRESWVAAERGLGETLLVYQGDALVGFALCCGGRGALRPGHGAWIRTLAVERGDQAIACAERLVQACESLAREWGEPRIGLPLDPQHPALFDWLDADGYRPQEMYARMVHGIAPRTTDGVCWHDWR